MQTEREIIPLDTTKKIILRNFVWSIQKNDVSLHSQTKKNRMPMLNLTYYFPITDPTLIFFVVLLIVLFALSLWVNCVFHTSSALEQLPSLY